MATTAISVQLYSVREHLTANAHATIDRLADMGLAQVEVGIKFLKADPELLPAIRRRNMATPTLTASLVGVDRAEVWAMAKELGAHTVIDTYIPEEQWNDQADVDRIAAELNAAATEAAEHGLRVGYHNHWWELETVVDNDATAFDSLIAQLDERVILEIDAYWVAVGGHNPVEFVTRHRDRVKYLHLKDGPISRDNSEQKAAGSGNMPIPALLAAASGLEAAVIEFDEYPGDVFAAIEQSRQYLAAQVEAQP